MTEPHAKRRALILREHPSVCDLFGTEPSTKFIAVMLVMVQIACAVMSTQLTWPMYLFTVYAIGATASQALFLVNHELCHDLVFSRHRRNVWFGYFVNLPTVFPYTASFRTYHIDHHRHLGHEGLDVDLPTRRESAMFGTLFGRLAWLSVQVIAYSVRPLLVNPKAVTPDVVANACVQAGFNLALYAVAGPRPFAYLLACTVVSGGLHPSATHFLSEHTAGALDSPLDTFSYYGAINRVTLNVGYHVEHHDFTKIPWSRLPELKRRLPEHYDLPAYASWTQPFAHFLWGAPRRMRRY